MKTIKRNLDLIEKEKLNARISEIKDDLSKKFHWKAIFILTVITASSAIDIYNNDDSNWSLISKFLVCVAPIGIWVVIEQYFKNKKNGTKELNHLKAMQNEDLVSVVPIELNRIAKLEEYEDEGDLYLIETKDEKCIYLWDAEYLLINDIEFPREKVEVYTDDIFKFGIYKKVKCYGNKLTPIVITGKNKWSFYGKVGFPEDLEKEEKSFDTIIKEMKNESLV